MSVCKNLSREKLISPFVALLIVFAGAQALAQTTAVINSVTGVSKFDSTSGNYKIYGGIAGTCASASATETCNTCTDTTGGLKPCNRAAIHANLDVNLTYTSASALSSPTTLTLKIGSGSATETTLDTETSTGTKTYTFTTKWGNICSAIAGSSSAPAGLAADCTLSGTADVNSSDFELRVYEGSTEVTSAAVVFHGIPTDNLYPSISIDYQSTSSGISLYEFFPGDQKLILLGYTGPAAMPTGTPELDAVVFFLEPHAVDGSGQVASVTTNTYGNGKGPTADFTWTASTSTLGATAYIEGLENEVTYCVIAGHMNKAQNIFLFTSTSFDTSKMCKSPNRVVGALEDTRCFISTAAFGSPWNREVRVLRQFRDRYLVRSQFGKKLVAYYYDVSPPLAEQIKKSETLKSIARFLLLPAVWFAEWSLKNENANTETHKPENAI